MTLSAFGREFLDRDVAVNTPCTLARYEGAFTRVTAVLGDRLLQDITTDDVQGYKAARMKDGMKPATINRELAFLRRVFNVALQRNKVGHTPFRHNGVVVVKLLREDNQRERYLTDEEETRLRAACAASRYPWLLSIVVTALHSRLRRIEMLMLRWRNLDLVKRRLIIRPTNHKSHRRLVIPFHDLRHTFASRLIEEGVPLLHVSKLLGHSTILMTQRYSHASEDARHDAVRRLDRLRKNFNVDTTTADPVPSETDVTAVH